MSAVIPMRSQAARVATTAMFVGNGCLVGAWAANLPRIREAYSLSDSGLGFLLLAFGVGAVAAMTMTSTIAARVGAARVASIAGIVQALLFPFVGLVAGGPALLALAALLGAACGTMDVAMNAAAAHLERRWGSPLMSSFHAGWSIGGLAGAGLAGVLTGLGWGLPQTLAAAAVVVAVGGLCGLTLPALDGPAQPGAAFRLPSRQLAGLSLLAALCFSGEGAVTDWTGVYLNTVVGTDEAWATTGYATFALAMVAGRLSGDAVVRRLGPDRTVRHGAMLAVAGLALALAVPNRWVVDAGCILIGLGLANVVPVVFSAAGRAAGTGGVAMVSGTGYAGLLVAPPILGNLADAIGLRLALALVLAGYAAIALLAGTTRPTGGE
jgi:predicted MFS family arabinose efflux permease